MIKENVHKHAAWGVLLVIVAGYTLMAVKFPQAYIVATYEDLVGEWAQVFLFAATLLFSIRIACRKSRYRLFFVLLALACFFVVGEEISWGQRIFNIATPDFFKTHNLQNETNLHNFFTGPIKTALKQFLTVLIALGLATYGLLYPLLINRQWKPAQWLNNKGLLCPPIYLWPVFISSAFLELGFLHFNEAEIAEILIPLALAIMAINYLHILRREQSETPTPNWNSLESRKLAWQTTLLTVTITVLAFATTAICYSAPNLRQRIDTRYNNGLEKFADRYKRMEWWDSAEYLYLVAHERKPQKAEILQKLASCYLEQNNKQQSRYYLKKAEQLDFDLLAKQPLSVGAHLSLVETYGLMGEVERADDHLRGSLEIAKVNVERAPQSASAAYWFGRAKEKAGDITEALREYRRAADIQPEVLKYKKAVISLKKKIDTEQVG